MNKRPLPLIAAFIASLGLSSLLLAEIPERPYPAVIYSHQEQKSPPQLIYVAAIDLTQPNVKVRVSRGGADPDGPGPWTTTLMQPTKVADREGFDVVINGDFFAHLNGKDAEGAAALAEFKGSTPASVIGPAETDGVVWSKSKDSHLMLVFDKAGKPSIVKGTQPPKNAYQAIAGHDLLVQDGKNVAPQSNKPGFVKGPHPRTAVGLRDGGKTLLLVVVDGRKKGVATGMSLSELADVMVQLGAQDAINLDGGGSSVLAIRDPKTGKMNILNHPSDGRERAVGNVLGVQVEPRKSK